MITDAQLDHIIGLFDGVPFLKDQEISQALMELLQWRKLGREIIDEFKLNPIINQEEFYEKTRQLLAQSETE